MAGVKQVDFGIRHIALERLRTWSDERGIVPRPNRQNRRLVLAQPRSPRQIGRDIRVAFLPTDGSGCQVRATASSVRRRFLAAKSSKPLDR
jgi:hypothetical protein